jgi:hypothetical protein
MNGPDKLVLHYTKLERLAGEKPLDYWDIFKSGRKLIVVNTTPGVLGCRICLFSCPMSEFDRAIVRFGNF